MIREINVSFDKKYVKKSLKYPWEHFTYNFIVKQKMGSRLIQKDDGSERRTEHYEFSHKDAILHKPPNYIPHCSKHGDISTNSTQRLTAHFAQIVLFLQF